MTSPAEAPTAPPTALRASAPIVLIEDDATLRDSLAEYLTSKGYSVATAARGEEGINQVDSETEVVEKRGVSLPETLP